MSELHHYWPMFSWNNMDGGENVAESFSRLVCRIVFVSFEHKSEQTLSKMAFQRLHLQFGRTRHYLSNLQSTHEGLSRYRYLHGSSFALIGM